MLHPRPHLRFAPLELHGQFFDQPFGQRFDLAALGRHIPGCARAAGRDLCPLLDAEIACVRMDFLLLSVQ